MDQTSSHITVLLLLLFPLLGGLVGLLVRKKVSPYFSTFLVFLGLVFSIWIGFDGGSEIRYRWEWLPGLSLGWYIDHLSILLIILVYLISSLVHVFSIVYMGSDPGIRRYYFKLGFFTCSMLGLLAADHLVLVFAFWELVGFSSYLLIGFWYRDIQKADAARASFMINRVADAFLFVAILLCVVFSSSPYLSELIPGNDAWMGVAATCFAIGAFGKSAQLPFFGWLPKAMAGPTPVSALIHAATMVAAGVYLLVRVEAFLWPSVKLMIIAVGTITAMLSALSALTQWDIKRILAFSTISQLGYMMVGIGVGAVSASVFHLWTHAFFKAGLFLAAGAVIHYFHQTMHQHNFDPQDIRNMGGLRRQLPVVFYTFFIFSLALAGIPLFSGFLSKEGILTAAWEWAEQADAGSIAFIVPAMMIFIAFITPVYIGRLMVFVFFGSGRNRQELPAFKNLPGIILPLLVLSVASLWIGHGLHPFEATGWYLQPFLFSDSHPASSPWVFVLSITAAAAGAGWVWWRYVAAKNEIYDQWEVPPGMQWSHHSWFVETFYSNTNKIFLKIGQISTIIDDRLIDRIVRGIGISAAFGSKVVGVFDKHVVDGIVRLSAKFASRTGRLLAGMQAPGIQTQISWLILGFLLIIVWFTFKMK